MSQRPKSPEKPTVDRLTLSPELLGEIEKLAGSEAIEGLQSAWADSFVQPFLLEQISCQAPDVLEALLPCIGNLTSLLGALKRERLAGFLFVDCASADDSHDGYPFRLHNLQTYLQKLEDELSFLSNAASEALAPEFSGRTKGNKNRMAAQKFVCALAHIFKSSRKPGGVPWDLVHQVITEACAQDWRIESEFKYHLGESGREALRQIFYRARQRTNH